MHADCCAHRSARVGARGRGRVRWARASPATAARRRPASRPPASARRRACRRRASTRSRSPASPAPEPGSSASAGHRTLVDDLDRHAAARVAARSSPSVAAPRACLCTLVSASCTTRWAVRATASGSTPERRRPALTRTPAARDASTTRSMSSVPMWGAAPRPGRRRRAARRAPRAGRPSPGGRGADQRRGLAPVLRSSSALTSSAPACRAISDTLWASTSCISRAMRARSPTLACSARSSRSCSARSARSRSDADEIAAGPDVRAGGGEEAGAEHRAEHVAQQVVPALVDHATRRGDDRAGHGRQHEHTVAPADRQGEQADHRRPADRR